MSLSKISGMIIILFALAFLACATDKNIPIEDDDLFWNNGEKPETTLITEELAYTDQNYDFPADADFGLDDVLGKFPIDQDNGFMLLSPEFDYDNNDYSDYYVYNSGGTVYTAGEDADLSDSNGYPNGNIITAVVTIYPRFYIKIKRLTNSIIKHYGCFYIQDKHGGILVLHDSRIPNLNAGDKIRIRVRGLYHYYEERMILNWELVEIVEKNVPIYYYEVNNVTPGDYGKVVRVTGEIEDVPTNFNFNTGSIIPEGQTDKVIVSFDREINYTNIKFPQNLFVTLTGPCTESYNERKMIIMTPAQINIHEQR